MLFFTNFGSTIYFKRSPFNYLSFLLDNSSGSGRDSFSNGPQLDKSSQKSIKKKTETENVLNPVTYDKIPVFCGKDDSDLLKTPYKHGNYTYFMDYEDALEVVNNYFTHNRQGIFDTINHISIQKLRIILAL